MALACSDFALYGAGFTKIFRNSFVPEQVVATVLSHGAHDSNRAAELEVQAS